MGLSVLHPYLDFMPARMPKIAASQVDRFGFNQHQLGVQAAMKPHLDVGKSFLQGKGSVQKLKVAGQKQILGAPGNLFHHIAQPRKGVGQDPYSAFLFVDLAQLGTPAAPVKKLHLPGLDQNAAAILFPLHPLPPW